VDRLQAPIEIGPGVVAHDHDREVEIHASESPNDHHQLNFPVNVPN
jgi:hypothetical protein